MSQLDPALIDRIRAACTPTQADVLIAILNGHTVREIARSTGKHRTTIREQYRDALAAVERHEAEAAA